MGTDQEWEQWGERDPYFGVITDPKFRKNTMTSEAKYEFFCSGQLHVDRVFTSCRGRIEASFAPKRVLDFGCGVGRLLPAFAAHAEAVVGVDISAAMLEEARRNCDDHHVGNVTLVRSDDALSAVEGRFDLVHSAIVLQHLDPDRGLRIVERLIGLLAPGGIGALQLVYGKAYYASTLGVAPPASTQAPHVGAPRTERKRLPWFMWRRERVLDTAVSGASVIPATDSGQNLIEMNSDPEMLMNPYNLNKLFFLLQRADVTGLHAEFTDHGGELGVFLFFQKP